LEGFERDCPSTIGIPLLRRDNETVDNQNDDGEGDQDHVGIHRSRP
jgi:hypothetical protein